MRTAEAARRDGLTIDETVYPWIAYRGPRFEPAHWELVLTDKEAAFLALCEAASNEIGRNAYLWEQESQNFEAEKELRHIFLSRARQAEQAMKDLERALAAARQEAADEA